MIIMDVRRLDELKRQLTTLGEEVGMKVLCDAGHGVLEVVEEDMKQHVGFDNASSAEYMHDSTKIRASTREGCGSAVVILRVGPNKKHYTKALARELGTVKRVAGLFIRPALDYNVQKVLHILTVEIRNGIQNRQ